jgi:hypothetical protein
MTDFTWIQKVRELTPEALTVRAQTISPNDSDTLLWDSVMPRQNVSSVKLTDISTLDFRPVSDRREWNARGRLIPMLTPPTRNVEIVPVEAYDKLQEQEIQALMERVLANEALFRQLVGVDIPTRVDRLVRANYRRIEVDAFSAWILGQITQMNPQSGQTYVASFNFDGARYQTPAAWTGGSAGTAFANLVSWLKDARDAVGLLDGLALRQSTMTAIEESTPYGAGLIELNQAQVADRISQAIGGPFRFAVIEHSVDVFTDGGVTTARTKVFPAQHIAVIPAGGQIGYTAFAPVVRAMQLAAQVPEAGIDVNGQTVFYDTAGLARELTFEAQVNALPIPNEQKLYVANVGI